MKTRLFPLVIILMLSASVGMAQSTGNAKMTYGALAGINFQNINGKDSNGDKLNNDMIVGFHVGVNMMVPIVPEFFFQPGLLLSTKGAKAKYSISNTSYTETYKLTYLEVPMNFVYKGALGDGFVMVGFGPYLGYGIGGKAKIEGGSLSQEKKIKFKSSVGAGDDPTLPYYRAFDAGANIFAGYEMASGIFAQFNTQLGLVKINSEYKAFPDDKTSEKNTGFGISVGYRF